MAHGLTVDDISDRVLVGELVASAGGWIRRLIADGVCDGEPICDAIRRVRPLGSSSKIVIPPHGPSFQGAGATWGGLERERDALRNLEVGRKTWHRDARCGLRRIVGAAVFGLDQIL